jgi:hypothetical protein
MTKYKKESAPVRLTTGAIFAEEKIEDGKEKNLIG